jgi:hypothetical protein
MGLTDSRTEAAAVKEMRTNKLLRRPDTCINETGVAAIALKDATQGFKPAYASCNFVRRILSDDV